MMRELNNLWVEISTSQHPTGLINQAMFPSAAPASSTRFNLAGMAFFTAGKLTPA